MSSNSWRIALETISEYVKFSCGGIPPDPSNGAAPTSSAPPPPKWSCFLLLWRAWWHHCFSHRLRDVSLPGFFPFFGKLSPGTSVCSVHGQDTCSIVRLVNRVLDTGRKAVHRFLHYNDIHIRSKLIPVNTHSMMHRSDIGIRPHPWAVRLGPTLLD